MICNLCGSIGEHSAGGFCGGRRCISKNVPVRNRLAARWLARQYEPMRLGRDMTQKQVLHRSITLQHRLSDRFDTDSLLLWGLDNPFMSDDARAVMVNEATRYIAKCQPKYRKRAA